MIKAIITDIEGTTTSISFVKDVLFPYARANLAEYVQTHLNDPTVQSLLQDTLKEVGKPLNTQQLIEQLIAWIDTDQKITPLKALQGLIWAHGYHQGAFTGHLYDDAITNLQQWHQQGIALYVYSSGSVHAQKLLFSHTTQGDLTPLFTGYFDTRVGAKQDPEAYRNIVSHIGLPANELLFLSDIEAELDAAKAVGLNTIWLCRDTPIHTPAAHHQVLSFDDITL